MCTYNVGIDDAVMEEVRPSIAKGMEEDAWVQLQVEMLSSQMAASLSPKRSSKVRLSERLRGIGHALADFDYKKELATFREMMLHSRWKDFDDAVQNFSACVDPLVSAIITRNTKDFKKSELEIIDSVDFL